MVGVYFSARVRYPAEDGSDIRPSWKHGPKGERERERERKKKNHEQKQKQKKKKKKVMMMKKMKKKKRRRRRRRNMMDTSPKPCCLLLWGFSFICCFVLFCPFLFGGHCLLSFWFLVLLSRPSVFGPQKGTFLSFSPGEKDDLGPNYLLPVAVDVVLLIIDVLLLHPILVSCFFFCCCFFLFFFCLLLHYHFFLPSSAQIWPH